jgi:hypothetical protein
MPQRGAIPLGLMRRRLSLDQISIVRQCWASFRQCPTNQRSHLLQPVLEIRVFLCRSLYWMLVSSSPLDHPQTPNSSTPQIVDARLPVFNATTRKVHSEIGRTCSALVDVIEEGLRAPPGSISGRTSGGEEAELNLIFLPKVNQHVLEGREARMKGIWPHSDLSVMSALLQHGPGASGLEFEVRRPQRSQFAP